MGVLGLRFLGHHCLLDVSLNPFDKDDESRDARTFDVRYRYSQIVGLCFGRPSLTSSLSCFRRSFFIGLFLTFAVDVEDGSSSWIGVISLHPVGSLSYGLQVIGQLEDQDTGLQSSTVGSTDTVSGWTFNNSIQSLIIDSLIYGYLVSALSS